MNSTPRESWRRNPSKSSASFQNQPRVWYCPNEIQKLNSQELLEQRNPSSLQNLLGAEFIEGYCDSATLVIDSGWIHWVYLDLFSKTPWGLSLSSSLGQYYTFGWFWMDSLDLLGSLLQDSLGVEFIDLIGMVLHFWLILDGLIGFTWNSLLQDFLGVGFVAFAGRVLGCW